jgi:hypothetical protein
MMSAPLCRQLVAVLGQVAEYLAAARACVVTHSPDRALSAFGAWE